MVTFAWLKRHFKPLERMNCHVTTTSPLPRSHVHALRDPHWEEAMLDEYNALISNGTMGSLPARPANFLRDLGPFHQLDVKNVFSSLSHYREGLYASTSCVCLYMHDPREPHFTALKHIIRYVRVPLDYGLQLSCIIYYFSLLRNTDADWLGSRGRRASSMLIGDDMVPKCLAIEQHMHGPTSLDIESIVEVPHIVDVTAAKTTTLTSDNVDVHNLATPLRYDYTVVSSDKSNSLIAQLAHYTSIRIHIEQRIAAMMGYRGRSGG
ncbi:ribonuclease H-like domain-containing protein [Tanacetum coccineum]